MSPTLKILCLAIIAVAVYIGVAMWLVPMPAMSAPRCDSVEEVKAAFAKTRAEVDIIEIGGGEVKSFLACYNALPPESSVAGDYAVVLRDAGNPMVAVILFNHGCFAKPVLFVAKTRFDILMGSL
jgi:hypothetical protein